MQEEMDSLIKNKAWILINKPKLQKIVDCKQVYKIEEGEPNSGGKRYKAILV